MKDLNGKNLKVGDLVVIGYPGFKMGIPGRVTSIDDRSDLASVHTGGGAHLHRSPSDILFVEDPGPHGQPKAEVKREASMKITVIVAKTDGEETPWVLGAWDEYMMDADYKGFCDAVAQYRRSMAGAEIRTAEIEVPEGFLDSIWKPILVRGKVLEQKSEGQP